MILPNERTIKENEEHALRNAISRMVSAETVKAMHIPALGKHFTNFFSKCVPLLLCFTYSACQQCETALIQMIVAIMSMSGDKER